MRTATGRAAFIVVNTFCMYKRGSLVLGCLADGCCWLVVDYAHNATHNPRVSCKASKQDECIRKGLANGWDVARQTVFIFLENTEQCVQCRLS